MFFTQLIKLSLPVDKVSKRKAKLCDHTYVFIGTSLAQTESTWKLKYFCVLKTSYHNKPLVITKPVKGSGVIILNHNDYVR